MLVWLAAGAWAQPVASEDAESTVSQTWQMLDYLAADYPGAVQNGAVVSASEYAEMREFSATTRERIQGLPATPATPSLLEEADQLIASVQARAAPEQISQQAHALADALLQAYPVPTAPQQAPDLVRGAVLYQESCAPCHGVTGHGDGPAGLKLDPRPIDFTDQHRADQRSALSLYEVISQGLAGTPMVSFAKDFSVTDRWALAYYVSTLPYIHEGATGAKAWQHDSAAQAQIASLKDLSHAQVSQLAPLLGIERARVIVGYLRAHPDALSEAPTGVALARGRLAASVAAYRAGELTEATRLALSAYLDGIEPVEPQLNARDGALRVKLETAMGAYRTALSGQDSPDSIARRAGEINALLDRSDAALLQATGNPTATFLGAFTILVREGLEALLVVVALLAFLRKAERHDVVRYVHTGWVLALLAGAVTWAIASYAVAISGASRELTEGLSSLFAAVVLISVGLWMHQKSIGTRWQAYIKKMMSAALNRRSAWFLFGLAFISVYREVFETILFYAALWNEGNGGWLLSGVVSGALVLGLIAWVLLRTSRRLPIAKFFLASSTLIAVLAFVLTGKGVAALQEAGWVPVATAPVPHIELLGIYPTWQPVLAQLAVLAVLGAGLAFNIVRARATSTPAAAA